MTGSMRTRKLFYVLSIALLTLSGFAQMPIFKRYYIADIPGLGWLAKFYITHSMHYILAAVLIAFAVYVVFDYLLTRKKRPGISVAGYMKIGWLLLLIASGVFLVVRNLKGVYFSHGLIIGLDLIHLIACMGLLFTGLYTWVRKKKWVY